MSSGRSITKVRKFGEYLSKEHGAHRIQDLALKGYIVWIEERKFGKQKKYCVMGGK
jgi:hypothetical protein